MKLLPQDDLHEVASRCAKELHTLDGAHVLITGASGFIGSWLLDSLRYARVIMGLSIRVTVHHRGALRRPWATEPGDGQIVGDIRALDRSLGHFEDVTHVLHCASAASHTQNLADPAGVCDMIAGGTARVVKECERVGVKRLLHLSSGSVYANGEGPPEYAPIRAVPKAGADNAAMFAYAKVLAERAAFQSTVPVVVARAFSLIGPRLGSQFAAAQFMADAIAGRPVAVKAPGTVRSYLYAADLAAWLWTLLVRGEAGTAYNVGASDHLDMGFLADFCAREGKTRVEWGTGTASPPFFPIIERARLIGLDAWTIPLEGMKRWYRWEMAAQ